MGPFADSAIYSIYGSQDATVLALKKGDIDFMLNPLGLSRGLQEQLEGEDGLTVIENASDGMRYLGFNFRKQPMESKAFRQAVATLIDKEFITSTVLQGVALPMYTTVPEGNQAWYNPDVPLIGKGLSRGERIDTGGADAKGRRVHLGDRASGQRRRQVRGTAWARG